MRLKAPTHDEWTTRDELHFVDHLGRWTFGTFLGQRVKLLRGYLAGLDLRTEWDGLDRERVISYTEEALARELRRALARELA